MRPFYLLSPIFWRAAPPLSPNFYLLSPKSSAAKRALLFPVDLRPNSEHDVAEEEGVEGDVAAEVEGEDDAIRRMSPHPC